MPKGEIATLSTKFQISIPKGNGVLLVPVPELDDLSGLARGGDPRGYPDRDDRY